MYSFAGTFTRLLNGVYFFSIFIYKPYPWHKSLMAHWLLRASQGHEYNVDDEDISCSNLLVSKLDLDLSKNVQGKSPIQVRANICCLPNTKHSQ